MAVKFLTGQQANDEKTKAGVNIIGVYAEWCGPCQMMAPIFEEISETTNVVKVNVDEGDNKEWAKSMGATGLPTTFIFKDGNLTETITGYTPKEVLEAKLA